MQDHPGRCWFGAEISGERFITYHVVEIPRQCPSMDTRVSPVRRRSLSPVPDLRERWRTSLIEATTYDWAVEHEHIAGVLGRLIWGTDTAAFYRDIARLSELPAGTSVLDIPCGGGVAFRGVRPEQELHYVAADLSPLRLRRARAAANRRGIHWIAFAEADVAAPPVEDRGFALGVTS